ncbi:hypothetical protein BH10PSE8_BH10PSE8_21050 [soil metagenome]
MTTNVIFGLDPSMTGLRFWGLRAASPENDVVAYPAARRAARQITHCRCQAGIVMIVR